MEGMLLCEVSDEQGVKDGSPSCAKNGEEGVLCREGQGCELTRAHVKNSGWVGNCSGGRAGVTLPSWVSWLHI